MNQSLPTPDSFEPPSAVPSSEPSIPLELNIDECEPADDDQESADLPTRGGPYLLTWMMTATALLLASTWVIPYLVEQVEYARERGRQRAKLDVATVGLKSQPLQELSQAYQLVSQRVGPSVVHINIKEKRSKPTVEKRRPIFDDRDQESFDHPVSGQGSGVIMDQEGYILTNRHVVENADKIEVTLSDGRHLPARVVGEDEKTDLAVLKIEASNLAPAEWGDSEQLDPGALVWAVGSPFGLEQSITFGILSAKHRAAHAGNMLQDLMQTDAAVNPGNSGGPLVDINGQVIGINTAIAGSRYQGISFAIPSSIARDIYERLKKSGRVERGWLGVEMAAVTMEKAEQLGMSKPSGVFVRDLVSPNVGNSPAREAGIEREDVIVRWNSIDVTSPTQLLSYVARADIGTHVRVTVLRGGQELDFDVVVGQRPNLEF